MSTFSKSSSVAGTDLRFKQGLVLAMLEEANRAVLAAAGHALGAATPAPKPVVAGGDERIAERDRGQS